jgi:hypothetical protein
MGMLVNQLTAINAPRRLPKSIVRIGCVGERSYFHPYIPNMMDDNENVPELQKQAMTKIGTGLFLSGIMRARL